MRAPEALPFNATPRRETRVPFASADDPAQRRWFPLIAVALMLVITALAFWVGGPLLGTLIGITCAAIGGLVLWMRSMD